MSLSQSYRGLPTARKITVLGVASATAALALTILLLGTIESIALRRQLASHISSLAEVAATNAAAAAEKQDANAARSLVESLRTDRAVELAQIFTSGGDALATFARHDTTHAARSTIEQVRDEHRHVGDARDMFDARLTSSNFHAGYLDVTAPIVLDGKMIGFVRLVAGLDALHRTLALYACAMLAVAAAAIGMAYLVALKLRDSITPPPLDSGSMSHLAPAHRVEDSPEQPRSAIRSPLPDIGAQRQTEKLEASLEQPPSRSHARFGDRESAADIETTLPMQSLDGAVVMLVEDNEVNREVAVGMLQALGCTVEVAEHGGIAVAMFPTRRWHAILMDCQMPVMDGLAATREIRNHEARNARARTPVIALTANATEEDRDRCVAIGMDDFVSKPVTITQLRKVLEKWIGIASAMDTASMRTAPTDAILDQKALDAIRAIPSRDLLQRMIALYEEHTPRLILEGDAALDARDCQRIAVAVHELKSCSGNLGGQRLVRLCKECEAAARSDDLAAVERLWPQIASEYTAFRAALTTVLPMESAA